MVRIRQILMQELMPLEYVDDTKEFSITKEVPAVGKGSFIVFDYTKSAVVGSVIKLCWGTVKNVGTIESTFYLYLVDQDTGEPKRFLDFILGVGQSYDFSLGNYTMPDRIARLKLYILRY